MGYYCNLGHVVFLAPQIPIPLQMAASSIHVTNSMQVELTKKKNTSWKMGENKRHQLKSSD